VTKDQQTTSFSDQKKKVKYGLKNNRGQIEIRPKQFWAFYVPVIGSRKNLIPKKAAGSVKCVWMMAVTEVCAHNLSEVYAYRGLQSSIRHRRFLQKLDST